MRQQTPLLQSFKGLALFTPGGDLVYAIDTQKRDRWHLQLCIAVQEILGLPEPPHFLMPCYCATVDRYLDPRTQAVRTIAEVAPAVWRYRAVLNAVFGLEGVRWGVEPIPIELCNPLALAGYREQFPQLWTNHNAIVRVDAAGANFYPREGEVEAEAEGYIFRLFLRGDSPTTEDTLERLHRTLDRALGHPYTLKLIDVLKHPQQAESDRVSATPTLIRVWPEPVRRIVGELDDLDRILGLLGNR
ncbi:circadian clock KaiB family protein [Baaleninema simplex]|uniref:circadian clock KaiB family protein n=1 Tax=Baaleninema simplex TaxID=2862350 RepID=UPI000475F3EA|nr:circadian clock KaiB family protein [Baaleninema simplex]